MTSQNVLLTYSDFTAELKRLDSSAISEDTSCCNICLEDFADQILNPIQEAFQALPLDKTLKDDPILLPCGHIFGELCFTMWSSSGKTTCPLCRAVLFQNGPDAGLEAIIRQFHLLPSTSFRALIKPEWDEKSGVILKDEMNSLAKLLARLAKFIFIVTIRLVLGSSPAKLGLSSPNPTQEFRYPTSQFPLDSDDASNFRTWAQTYLDAFMKANKLKKECLGGFYVDIVALLSDHRIATFYGFACAMFKKWARSTLGGEHAALVFHPRDLYSVLQKAMNSKDEIAIDDYGDSLRPSRIVGMAAKAAVEYERRLSELTRQRAEMTGIHGFRDLEEGDEVYWEDGRFRFSVESEAYWHPFSKVAVELE